MERNRTGSVWTWAESCECPLRLPSPEIVAGCSQQNAVGLDGSTLHQQHHVVQDAALSQSQQAVQQAAEVGRTRVGLPARAIRRAGAPSRRTHLSVLGHGSVLLSGLRHRRLSHHAAHVIRAASPRSTHRSKQEVEEQANDGCLQMSPTLSGTFSTGLLERCHSIPCKKHTLTAGPLAAATAKPNRRPLQSHFNRPTALASLA